MFGPNASLFVCGDHNVSILGRYMFDVEEKTSETNAPIIIEDDVWVGAIVNKNVSIVGGIHAKKIKDRFTRK